MATDAGVTNITSTRVQYIFFLGHCPFEWLSERCRLDLQGKNFFCWPVVPRFGWGVYPGFFFAFGTIPIRFDKIEPVAVIVRFW